MPADVWYGADCETRIGRRANANTPPTTWQSIDFMTLTINPVQEWRDRPKVGVAGSRQNVLDPTKPRKGFFRLTSELVVDADSRTTALWLLYSMGAPVSSPVSTVFAHVFSSGSKAEQYFDLVVKVGDTDFRVYEAMTLAQLSVQVTGENVSDFNINLSLRGLRRSKVTAWPTGALTAAPAQSPMYRATFSVDDVLADSMLSASFTYDRQLLEGVYLSNQPTVTSNRPNGGSHTGSATFRAIGAVFDGMEESDTVFKPQVTLNGSVLAHSIYFQHPQALLAPSPLPINGPGLIERSMNWTGFQSPTAAAARIVVTNDVASYA